MPTAIDPKIFKAYDIRGLYPAQIDAEIVYKIAQAYVELFKPRVVAVGHDMRLSGEEFKEALVKGLTAAGVSVVDLGLISTDTLYFAVPFLNLDGGLMATASHNPKEYGGLKMVRAKGYPVSGDTGIYDIRDLVIKGLRLEAPIKGEIEKKSVTSDYIVHILRTFDIKAMKPLKIVANTNFGMANMAVQELAKKLPIQFVEVLNSQLNGSFPKGPPDPLLPQNRNETMAAIVEKQPDLGIAWDGDADRVFFFDERGEYVRPPYITALLAEYYLQKYPGSKILHDTRIVRVIDEVVAENGGVSVMNKAGHSFIKERMIQDDVLFGAETSGHYYFKDNYYLDNGVMPFLAVLEILSKSNLKFSELMQPFCSRYAISDEINLSYTNKEVTTDLSTYFQDAEIDQIDGYDFNYPTWRFNVRLSNTEPLLRLNVEAKTSELLQEKTARIMGLLEEIKDT